LAGRSGTILITDAAGNLGSRLARQLVPSGHCLRLMVHRTPLPEDLLAAPNVDVVRADLARPETLPPAVAQVGACRTCATRAACGRSCSPNFAIRASRRES